MTPQEASLRTLAHIARALRDDDDMVLLLLRFADVFDDKTVSADEAYARLKAITDRVVLLRQLTGTEENQ